MQIGEAKENKQSPVFKLQKTTVHYLSSAPNNRKTPLFNIKLVNTVTHLVANKLNVVETKDRAIRQ